MSEEKFISWLIIGFALLWAGVTGYKLIVRRFPLSEAASDGFGFALFTVFFIAFAGALVTAIATVLS